MAGMLTGIIRMCLDFVYAEPACGEKDLRPSIVKDVIIYHSFFNEKIFILHLLVSLFIFCNFIVLDNCYRNDCCKFSN